MPNQINRDIYVLSSKVKDPIDYVRLTNDIPIVFTFRDYDIPSGSAAQVYVQKPSGKAVYDTAAISGNVVTVTVTDQMFAELGVSNMQIRLTRGDEKLVSFLQPVKVHPNYTDGDAEQSKNTGGFFDDAEQAVENANQAAGLANQAAQAANEAAEAIGEAVSGVINDDRASTVTTYSSAKIDEKLQEQTSESVIDDSTTSDTKTFSSQKINNTYLQKTGDASETTVTYKTSTGNAPASGGKLSALIGWLIGKCGQVGTLTTLATTAKTNLVSAINECAMEIGNLTALTTDEKTDLVSAINETNAGLSDKISGYDQVISVSNPFTPKKDGILRIYYRASSSTTATVYATEDGSPCFYGSAIAGGSLMQYFPAKAGKNYNAQASQNGTIQLYFIGFSTE